MLKRILGILEVKKESIPTQTKMHSMDPIVQQLETVKYWHQNLAWPAVILANAKTYCIAVAPGRFKLDIK